METVQIQRPEETEENAPPRISGLLESIGNTPLVELQRIRVERGARYLSTSLFRSICAECPP